MDSKLCPRCKEPRLKEWFGDPKAPYAICLSCRVELNGPNARSTRGMKLSHNCAICEKALLEKEKLGELCNRCQAGIEIFKTTRLLGRAASFVAGKLRKPKRQKSKRLKRRNHQLQELIRQQNRDDKERGLRFEREGARLPPL